MGKPRTSVRRALSLTFLQTGVSFVFTFSSVIIVSHLLTPAEIGIFSVATGLVALIHMLRDFGVGEFLVQAAKLDETLVRTVFTINLTIAWFLALILVAISGSAGQFFGAAGVSQVLRVLAIVFVLLPFGAITQARLKRNFQFGRLVRIHLAENITRSTMTVILAYAGFSYMSMAWSSVISIMVMVLACSIWGWEYRVRGLNLSGWRNIIHFGANRTIADIVAQLGSQSANLIIGKTLGMADVGLYSRGYGVINMYRAKVVGAINVVAFPAFAREHRDSGKAPELFLKSTVYLTGISWPFFAAGIFLAHPIIQVLFGTQWDAAVPLMRWLCAAALVGTLTFQCNQFLVALGRVRAVTQVVVEYQLLRVGVTIAAAFISVEAVAAVQVLVYIGAVILYYGKLHEYRALAFGKMARALWPSALVAVATCIVPAAVFFWPGLASHHVLVAFVVGIVGGGLGWCLAILALNHPILEDVRRVILKLGRFLPPALRGVFKAGSSAAK